MPDWCFDSMAAKTIVVAGVIELIVAPVFHVMAGAAFAVICVGSRPVALWGFQDMTAQARVIFLVFKGQRRPVFDTLVAQGAVSRIRVA
jgi:hypothetical protein